MWGLGMGMIKKVQGEFLLVFQNCRSWKFIQYYSILQGYAWLNYFSPIQKKPKASLNDHDSSPGYYSTKRIVLTRNSPYYGLTVNSQQTVLWEKAQCHSSNIFGTQGTRNVRYKQTMGRKRRTINIVASKLMLSEATFACCRRVEPWAAEVSCLCWFVRRGERPWWFQDWRIF
jgi:hypothetical protein